MSSNFRSCAGVGISKRAGVDRAVDEALSQARAALHGAPPVLAIAYAGVAHDQEALHRELSARLEGVPVVGGSTQGVYAGGACVEAERVLAVALLAGSALKVRVAMVRDIRGDGREHGRNLAAQLGDSAAGPGTTLLYYDPLGGADAEALLRGLADGGFPEVYGGATGQPWGKMVGTWQFAPGALLTSGAVAVRIQGLKPIADLTHGAETTGLEVTVTRAAGNIIYELDGGPALDVWCQQLGVTPDRTVENTSNWALGVRPREGTHYEGFITRAPFKLDVENRSIVLQAPVPEGARVQVCIRTQPAVYNGAIRMAERLKLALAEAQPVLALGFECGARPGPFLGAELAQHEVHGMVERLPQGIPWIGTYAWGEIAPVGGRTEFHNFTFPLCYLCEP
ncbi:MAG: FIST C-terminal domain-containing protein [Myxococcales bacterium]|nr:FIST C-terminal domain-containing protein [Myxococcales bacterium]